MYIYCITNNITKQVYIGQTVNFTRRMRQHISSNVSNIDKAINEYGEHSFSYDILFECNQCDVNLLENYLIYIYDSVNKGYNIAYKTLTLEEKLKAKALYDSILNNTYILNQVYISPKCSIVYRIAIIIDDNIVIADNISEASDKTGVSTSRIKEICEGGQRRSAKGYEFRYIDFEGNIIETGKQKRVYRVYVPETQTIYLSIKDACYQLGLDYESNRTNIGHCITGRHKMCNGYHFVKVDNTTDISDLPTAQDMLERLVCMDDNIFFTSIQEAVTYLGLNSKRADACIREACRGLRGTSFGHTWCYTDTYGIPLDRDEFVYADIDRSKVERFEIVCDNIIVFKSLRKAVEYFNLPLHNTAKIAKACKGLIPNPVFNHTWRYGNKLTK